MDVRRASPDDAADVAHLLHDFNTECDDPTPSVSYLTGRIRQLLAEEQLTVLLVGQGPDGFAQIRFRPWVWTDGLDAYLEELYVVPSQRGKGMGRALLQSVMEVARETGAAHLELTTGETDVAARALYESAGFTNREGGEDGPSMLYYERDL
jgi:ribosomal protein S18 acetylase RimI-like enzyme